MRLLKGAGKLKVAESYKHFAPPEQGRSFWKLEVAFGTCR
jgi:hypothetical protein